MLDFVTVPASHSPDAAKPRFDVLPTLQSVSRSLHILLHAHLLQVGVRPGEDQILCRLDEDGPFEFGSLQRAIRVRPSTLSKLTDRLEREGVLRREIDPQDRRRVLLSLTPLGRQRRQIILGALARLDRDLRQRLSGEMQDGLDGLAETLANAAARWR